MRTLKVRIWSEDNPVVLKFLAKLEQDYSFTAGVLKNASAPKKYRTMAGAMRVRRVSLAQVASYHEQGRGVPQRSFIKSTYFEHKKIIEKRVSKAFKMAAKKSSILLVESEFRKLGAYLTNKMKTKLRGKNNWPPLSPNTRPKDKYRTPLKATGQLLDSISYKVTRNGKVI